MPQQPAKKLRIGYLTATIWENQANGDSKFYSVELTRTYKDGDDYRTTNALNHGDILNAVKLLERAEHWISQQ